MLKKWLCAGFTVAAVLALSTAAVLAGGKLRGANVEVTDSGLGGYADAGYPDVATTGTVIYAAWQDDRQVHDREDIYLARSADGGATWDTNVNASNGLDNEIGLRSPSIAAHPDGSVYVVWFNPYPGYGGCVSGGDTYDTCVYMAGSADGTTFTRGIVWGSNDDSYYIEPQLAVDASNGDLVLAVSDWVGGSTPGGERIYSRVWDNGANQWRASVVNDVAGSATSSAGGLDGSQMAAVARDGIAYVAWEDARDGGIRIYGDKTTDHGSNWATDFAISPAGQTVSDPHLAVAPDGSLYAGYIVDEEVYVSRSSNQGASWSTPVRLADLPDFLTTNTFDLAVDDNGTVAVIWSVINASVTDLYLYVSIDQGQTFSGTHVEDADDIYGHWNPAIAAYGSGDGARAVMVWSDDRNTHDEIWSAHAELDATRPTAPTNLQATGGDTVVDLSWTAATDKNGIAGYYVIRATSSEGPYTQLNTQPLAETTYRDVGLDATPYTYKVYAVDSTGNVGSTSNEATATATAGTSLPVSGMLGYEVGNDIRLNDLPQLGNERAVAQGTHPQLDTAGERVYYAVNDAIVSRAVDGGDLQTSLSNANFNGEFEIARGDAAHLAWIQEKQYSQINPYASWTVLEPHYGSAAATDFVDTYEFAGSPTLSADRHWFAYTSLGYHAPSNLHDYGPASLAIVNLSTGQRVALYSDAHYFDPEFAPAGSSLAFASARTGQYEIWTATVNANGSLSNLTQLTHGAAGEWSLAPAWSSDGNWLVFARGVPVDPGDCEDPELQNPHLYIVQSDGSALRSLGITGDAPTWTGTGSQPTPTLDQHVFVPCILR